MRVLVAVGVFAAGGLAWTDLVAAAGHDISVTNDAAKCDKTWGPPCFTPANGTVTQVAVGDTVNWHVLDGTHTVTPVDPAAFTGSGDLTGPDATFNVTFDKPGVFSFYCKHHGSVDKDGKTFHGMWGKIDVRGDTTSTSAPPAPGDPPGGAPPPGNPDPGPPPAPGPSKPAPPPPPSSGSAPPPSASGGSGGSNGSSGNGPTAAGTGRPYVGPPPTAPPPAPAPRESASAAPHPSSSPSPAPGKGRDGGGGNDNASTPGATAVPPDEAVLPPSPAFPTPTTAPVAAAPTGAPQGDTVAVLKAEPGGKHRRIILLGTIVGVGAFVFGVGGWKYTHRASKYWPA
ncbi:MAG: Copper binding protein plastocyanin/azurin family [Actinomycetota bacterium]|nr:Copper binding protein plastocyanin/azurin family [Actinomycetota bacterium]